jgi:hypothetical protein
MGVGAAVAAGLQNMAANGTLTLDPNWTPNPHTVTEPDTGGSLVQVTVETTDYCSNWSNDMELSNLPEGIAFDLQNTNSGGSSEWRVTIITFHYSS